jgi:hypothetical protein
VNFEEAKAMSIKKWEYMVKNPLDTEYGMAVDKCGLCRKYLNYRYSCHPCPLYDEYCDGYKCGAELERWHRHAESENLRWAKYWAQKLLDRIKSLEAPQ